MDEIVPVATDPSEIDSELTQQLIRYDSRKFERFAIHIGNLKTK